MTVRPKILHISTVANPSNSVGGIVQALHKAALANGMDSFRMAGYGDACHADHTIISPLAYRFNAVRCRLCSEDGFIRSKAFSQAMNLLVSQRPDLVHLHNLHGYYCHLPCLQDTLTKLHVPVVLTLHDLWFTTGRCAHPPNGSCPKLKGHCHACPHPGRYPAKWISGKSMFDSKKDFAGLATIVIAPSRWVAERATGLHPSVIANGVDTGIFTPRIAAAAAHCDHDIIAIASRWTTTKGIRQLMNLADILPQGRKLTLVGADAPRHPRIERTGHISDRNKLAEMLRNSRVLLSAATEEAFGLTVAEALCCGIPAVVRRGTAPTQISGCGDILAADFDNPHDVLRTIQMAQTIKVSPHPELSVHSMTQAYLTLYKSIL